MTGGFRYLRFHGHGAKYSGRYGRRALRPVAADLRERGFPAYVYFNNDLQGHALLDALELKALLAEPARVGSRRSVALTFESHRCETCSARRSTRSG